MPENISLCSRIPLESLNLTKYQVSEGIKYHYIHIALQFGGILELKSFAETVAAFDPCANVLKV